MLSLIALAETSRRTPPAAAALPIFMGATASIEPAHRKRFKNVMERYGLGMKGFDDNMACTETVWRAVDTHGHTVNWLELVRQGFMAPPAFP